jgi:hypothetical protein
VFCYLRMSSGDDLLFCWASNGLVHVFLYLSVPGIACRADTHHIEESMHAAGLEDSSAQ